MELIKEEQIEKISDEEIVKCLNDERFKKYEKILLEWNEKINLTAITDEKEIYLKHFYDSLTVTKFIRLKDQKIIDIGTGAGFPGVPLKIFDDNLEITLVDSLNKRVNFLNEVIKELNLSKVNTIHGRAEELGNDENYREKYDIAISRAVAKMNVLAEFLLPFVKVGGYAIFMKGANSKEEFEEAKKTINILGGKVEKIENFYLDNKENERNIFIIKKIKNTPKLYPRNMGKIRKNPIK